MSKVIQLKERQKNLLKRKPAQKNPDKVCIDCGDCAIPDEFNDLRASIVTSLSVIEKEVRKIKDVLFNN